MRNLRTIGGTWVAMIVATVLFVASAIASAAPTYPAAAPATSTTEPPVRVPVVWQIESEDDAVNPGSASDTAHSTIAARRDAPELIGAVSGPNHGQVVRTVPEAVDGPLTGCAASKVAQSDVGKPHTTATTEDLDLGAVIDECSDDSPTHPDTTGPPDTAAKPETSGKPETPGKPDAPGPQGRSK